MSAGFAGLASVKMPNCAMKSAAAAGSAVRKIHRAGSAPAPVAYGFSTCGVS